MANLIEKSSKTASDIEKHIKVLESQSSSLKSLLSHLNERLDQLSYSLNSTKIHLDALRAEMAYIEELNKNWKSSLSNEMCLSVVKIKNPNTTLVKFSEVFLKILDVRDTTWKSFKTTLKNERFLKDLEDFDVGQITREKLDCGLEVLKSFHEIINKTKKYPKGVRVLVEILKGFIEFKMKKKLFEESLQEYLYYKKKYTLNKFKIDELNSMILIIEEKITELSFSKNEDSYKKEELETSDLFFNSPVQTQKVRVTYNSFTNGTASGGLLICGEKTSIMPKIQERKSESYYKQDEESYQMYIENQEKIGCCRSKFFCF